MKKSKGFTLIELLAVIVILSIMLSVTTIAVNNIKKKQDEKNYKNIISSILSGAKQYATENNISNGDITVKTLLEGEYVDFDQTKYSNLKNKKVNISFCDGSIKRKFSITINSSSYNDCGCEQQKLSADGELSSELCQ